MPNNREHANPDIKYPASASMQHRVFSSEPSHNNPTCYLVSPIHPRMLFSFSIHLFNSTRFVLNNRKFQGQPSIRHGQQRWPQMLKNSLQKQSLPKYCRAVYHEPYLSNVLSSWYIRLVLRPRRRLEPQICNFEGPLCTSRSKKITKVSSICCSDDQSTTKTARE